MTSKHEKVKAMQEKRNSEYYTTRTGAVYRRHLDEFGVKPVTLAWYDPRGPEYRKAIQRALKEVKPLNESLALSTQDKKEFDAGKLMLD